MVIEQNVSVGYVPGDFIHITCTAEDYALLEVCQNLIMKAETLQWLEQALAKHPDLLTLEDLVLRYGAEWGFSEAVISEARGRSELFEKLAGGPRFS